MRHIHRFQVDEMADRQAILRELEYLRRRRKLLDTLIKVFEEYVQFQRNGVLQGRSRSKVA